MKRSDFIGQVVALLNASGFDAEAKRLDYFSGKEGICVREINRRSVRHYMDGEVEYQVTYQVVVRRRNKKEAEDACWKIAELLSSSHIESLDASFEFDSQEVYTSPQELGLSESLFYAWEVRFNAEIRQKEGF